MNKKEILKIKSEIWKKIQENPKEITNILETFKVKYPDVYALISLEKRKNK